MFPCDLNRSYMNSFWEGSCWRVSFINRGLSPHTELHTVPIVPGPAEKLWTARSNPAIITQYRGWSSGKPKRNFLGMFFSLTACVTWSQSEKLLHKFWKKMFCFFSSVISFFLAWNVNGLKTLPDLRVKPVENSSKLLLQSTFLWFQEFRSLLRPSQDLLCFLGLTLHSFWSCFLCTQSCVYTHTQGHASTSPTLMTQRSCVDFICLWNRRNSLWGLRVKPAISAQWQHSPTQCAVCVSVCARTFISQSRGNLASRLNVNTQFISCEHSKQSKT